MSEQELELMRHETARMERENDARLADILWLCDDIEIALQRMIGRLRADKPADISHN